MCAIIVKSFGSNNKVKYINEKEKKKGEDSSAGESIL